MNREICNDRNTWDFSTAETQRTQMRKTMLLAALACLAACYVTAMSAPEKRDQATHVIIGKVERVFSRDSKNLKESLAQIRIESIEKGSGYTPQTVLHVYCFCPVEHFFIKATGPGRIKAPKEGQRVKAFVRTSQDGTVSGLLNTEWFDVLEPSK
jgi:hypothetical protein